jgi:hypothetical protein
MLILAHIFGIPVEEMLTPPGGITAGVIVLASLISSIRRFRVLR